MINVLISAEWGAITSTYQSLLGRSFYKENSPPPKVKITFYYEHRFRYDILKKYENIAYEKNFMSL